MFMHFYALLCKLEYSNDVSADTGVCACEMKRNLHVHE